MHDHDAVAALVERLTDGSTELPADVAEVRIRAGAAFSPERLQQAFDMQTPNTALAGSRLVVETRAEEHICPTCGHAWTLSPDDVAGHAILCPACGHPDALTGQAVIELLGVS